MSERRHDEIVKALALSREALAQLEGAAEGTQTPTAGVLARALRAILFGQMALLMRYESELDAREDATTIRPIPAERLEDDDEPIAPPLRRRPPAAKKPAAPAPPEPEPPLPSRPAGEMRDAIETVQTEAIAAFPLEEVNRWLASGTIFQIRGSLAFLNLRSMGGLKVDEMRGHIRRMGFVDELGRLVAIGLEGEVLLFRKAE